MNTNNLIHIQYSAFVITKVKPTKILFSEFLKKLLLEFRRESLEHFLCGLPRLPGGINEEISEYYLNYFLWKSLEKSFKKLLQSLEEFSLKIYVNYFLAKRFYGTPWESSEGKVQIYIFIYNYHGYLLIVSIANISMSSDRDTITFWKLMDWW